MNLAARLRTIISADPQRLRILQQVHELDLPDCWVAAGFVRSAIWDHLHQRSDSPLPTDIDVIWFDHSQILPARDAEQEAMLRSKGESLQWSVKNQARMHLRNGDTPYASATDAMRYWPETATAVAVRLDEQGEVEVAAPLGLEDLFNLIVRPAGRFKGEKQPIYQERLRSKNWLATWPRLKVLP